MPPIRSNQQTNWAFTAWPKYQEYDAFGRTVDDWFPHPEHLFKPDKMRFLIVGKETCPTTNKRHYQCYTQLHKKIRFNTLKALLPADAHLEPCKGSPDENIAYCSKEGDFQEFGTKPLNPGARTDLSAAVLAIQDGTPLDALAVDPLYMEVIARHMQYFRMIQNTHNRTAGLTRLRLRMANAILKPWQADLKLEIAGPVSDRKVFWLWCSAGGSGKSFMADYLVAVHDAVVFTHGKVADIAHAYDAQPVVIFDLSRTQEDTLASVYMCIENFKNGRFFSPKYDSHTKVFAPPHVVCFANFPPDQSKLSQDRWAIQELM